MLSILLSIMLRLQAGFNALAPLVAFTGTVLTAWHGYGKLLEHMYGQLPQDWGPAVALFQHAIVLACMACGLPLVYVYLEAAMLHGLLLQSLCLYGTIFALHRSCVCRHRHRHRRGCCCCRCCCV